MQSAESTTLHANGLSFSAYREGEGPVVLCLHGFPDCARSFRHQLPVLAQAGYCAVAPTLRGYEPSALSPDGDYHVVRMAEDVVAWLDALDAERAHLVGHDWGAVIAYAAAALAPERFHSLTTLAIPHPGRLQREGLKKLPSQLRNSWYMAFFQLRGLADWAIERNNWALIEKLWRDWSPGWAPPAEELACVKRVLAEPGVKRAALAYYRQMFDRRSGAAKRTNALFESPIRVRTLAFTGARDGCMDTRLHDLALPASDFPEGLEVVRIDEAGHFLHQEVPELVNPRLLDWLAEHEASS